MSKAEIKRAVEKLAREIERMMALEVSKTDLEPVNRTERSDPQWPEGASVIPYP